MPICQLPVQQDPLGGELEVGVVREAELAVDVRLRSAGGLTSSMTSMSRPIVTLSPAAGTLPSGQAAGSDQFVALTDASASWDATAKALTSREPEPTT